MRWEGKKSFWRDHILAGLVFAFDQSGGSLTKQNKWSNNWTKKKIKYWYEKVEWAHRGGCVSVCVCGCVWVCVGVCGCACVGMSAWEPALKSRSWQIDEKLIQKRFGFDIGWIFIDWSNCFEKHKFHSPAKIPWAAMQCVLQPSAELLAIQVTSVPMLN